MSPVLFWLLASQPAAGVPVPPPPCPPVSTDQAIYAPTDEAAFEIDSTAGAVGEVVTVTVSLRSIFPVPDSSPAVHLVVCHDPGMLDLFDYALTTEGNRLSRPTPPFFIPVDEGRENYWGYVPDAWVKGNGFFLSVILASYADYFPSLDPVPIAQISYRIRGCPGVTTRLEFCDFVLKNDVLNCLYNAFIFWIQDPETLRVREDVFYPTVKQGGEISVLPDPQNSCVARGDANADGGVDLADAVGVLLNLYQAGSDVACPNAADFNRDDIAQLGYHSRISEQCLSSLVAHAQDHGVKEGGDVGN